MQFLKILFWCLLAFVAALFTYGNWKHIDIQLWSGLVASVNLPLLLAFTFLVGFLPPQIYHALIRWRLRQRLATSERALADTRAIVAAPPPPVVPPVAQPAATSPVVTPPAIVAPPVASPPAFDPGDPPPDPA